MKVFVIAGEPSGDALGGALMEGLRVLAPEVTFDGVGGPAMQEQGLSSRFDMSELSLMGLVEILPKYAHLKRRVREMATAVVNTQPDVLITIDSPDFCLRVADIVRGQCKVPCVHYVAPSVWAWRPKRAQKMSHSVDHVLALLPFEPPYMEAAGMTCDFVGHPIATASQADAAQIGMFRAQFAPGASPLILALPGSRKSEVTRLSPVFADSLKRVCAQHPGARVVVPAAAPVASLVRDLVASWPGDPIVLDPRGRDPELVRAEKLAAFGAADVALAASGTVSLELAAAQTPMVIAYDMNWLSRKVVSRMLQVDTVTLVNLVSETRAVPEFIGADCRAELIAPAIEAVLQAPEAQDAAMALTMQRLGQGGEAPGLRAARSVLAHLNHLDRGT